MLDRKVRLEVPLPFKRISEYRSRHGIGAGVGSAGGAGKEKDTYRSMEDVLLCRGLLNEVRTFFEQELANLGEEPLGR